MKNVERRMLEVPDPEAWKEVSPLPSGMWCWGQSIGLREMYLTSCPYQVTLGSDMGWDPEANHLGVLPM